MNMHQPSFRRSLTIGTAMVAVILCSMIADAQEPAALKLAKTVPLPGVKGRFDHFAIDAKGQRLFVAALGNNTLEVVDIAAGKHLKSITGLHKPTSVVYFTDLNQIGVANGDDGTFKLFDGVSYAVAKSVSSLDDARAEAGDRCSSRNVSDACTACDSIR